MSKRVLVVMGSDSDYPVMEACFRTLQEFGVSFEAVVCSAHRTPDQAARLARSAQADGYGVIIAAAGHGTAGYRRTDQGRGPQWR
jgi:5-(carboxyamino)imidazole ribonucleotide mutase